MRGLTTPTVGPELRRLLDALGVAPQTTDDVAALLTIEPARVQGLLADAAEEGLVAFWDPEYATTWRAQRVLHPAWFRRAVPGSAAVGLAVTSVALFVGPPASAVTHGVAGACLAGAFALAVVAARSPTSATPAAPPTAFHDPPTVPRPEHAVARSESTLEQRKRGR